MIVLSIFGKKMENVIYVARFFWYLLDMNKRLRFRKSPKYIKLI